MAATLVQSVADLALASVWVPVWASERLVPVMAATAAMPRRAQSVTTMATAAAAVTLTAMAQGSATAWVLVSVLVVLAVTPVQLAAQAATQWAAMLSAAGPMQQPVTAAMLATRSMATAATAMPVSGARTTATTAM